MKSSKDNMIHIGPDYAIQGDRYCLTLYKRRIAKKTGLEQYDVIGYFTSIEALFHQLVDMDIGPINNLQDIAERIENLKGWISGTLENMAQNPLSNDLATKDKMLIPTALNI